MKKLLLSCFFLVFLSACSHHEAENKMYGKWIYQTTTNQSNEQVDYTIEFKKDKKTDLVLFRYTTKMGSYEQTFYRHYKVVSSTDKVVKLRIKGSNNILTVHVTDSSMFFSSDKGIIYKRITKN